jgi:hypothetical protein
LKLGKMTDDRNNGVDTELERKPGTFQPGNRPRMNKSVQKTVIPTASRAEDGRLA